MIHEAYTKAYIAQRYYQEKGKEVDREQARKNFNGLKKIDRKTLLKVINDIHKEQKKMLKES